MKAPGPIADPTANFGFRDIPADRKAGMVRAVFDSVAARYDLMNDLMSLGVHRLWKAAFVDWLRPHSGMKLLDVAGGTGDIALRCVGRCPGMAVAVCDINTSMLTAGRRRAIDRGVLSGVDWIAGDAEALPFADRSVDAYTIAFGLRNVTRIDAALKEARRVLRPGGRFLCLEFSRVSLPWLERAYDSYSFRWLPALGSRVAGDRDAYQYLVESIRRFPPQDELVRRIGAAGLDQVRFRNLSGGIAAIHSAWRV
ncbi:MAG: bifunctional demethylmenaquinone methyltransferase/2-methoxy-6-polyprenyl-1,4-benzoquinol methylase UbiE [Alphaproteobacteria bacterium]|nr:bifunctional demethylmenaquinone methyltransferase/2-methoxy-6-polyprenyl-1,4-benzoquinol methylase UbiE [Alphaproteobacteria bacterium]